MTTTPTPRAEVDIQGTLVGFLRRDIRQITDREREVIERLVESLRREVGADQHLTRVVIETDYPDLDRLAYRASYRVHVSARSTADDPAEPAGRRRRG